MQHFQNESAHAGKGACEGSGLSRVQGVALGAQSKEGRGPSCSPALGKVVAVQASRDGPASPASSASQQPPCSLPQTPVPRLHPKDAEGPG